MNMWSSGRRALQDVLSQPAVRSFSLSPAQNTVVVERWWQVPLSKVGRPPRLHPRRHRIYKLVEDTKHTPKEKMELILTQTVPKFGGRGDSVFVKKSVGRNKLLPEGLAVYPSPENKQIFAEELRLLREGRPEDRTQTRTGQMTVEFLQKAKLNIKKGPSDEFQLTKDVVCRQFVKKLGVVVPAHALNLPFEPIKDLGDYWCEVTVNGIDTVRVPMSLLPYEDRFARYQRQQQAAAGISEAVSDLAVEAVSDPAVEAVSDLAVEAVSDPAVEAVSDLAVEAVSDPAVEAVSDPAVVEAVSDAAVEAVSDPAVVEAVSDAAVEAVSDPAVEAVSDPAAVEAVSDPAAVEAVSDAAVKAEAGKDSESQASATAGSSAAEETAATKQTAQETTAPPSESPKKN